ncbi:protein AATF [Daktulosphaira vitifoliae]|uniref:protein AATF n=1 Tax=Daktulosphaira vitifoliae TaxID=58002 RepID=UPI0021AB00A4|nr:protein AATF [Daktulosphaira vitifoliae]
MSSEEELENGSNNSESMDNSTPSSEYEEDDEDVDDDTEMMDDESGGNILSDESEIEDDKYNDDKNDLIVETNNENDIEKGNAIRTQLTIYDNLLLARIKLQKCLAAANQLPKYNSELLVSESINNDVVIKSLQQFLETLFDLKIKLLTKNSNFMKTIEKDDILFDRVKCKDFDKSLKEQYDIFKPFRDDTIRFWNERTKIASGKAAKSDFSAFDQPTLMQIEQIMADKNRLIERTRTKRSKYKIVDDSKSTNNDVDPEIFDDDDFYHKLLRDYIEKKSADITDPSQLGKQWLQLQKLRSKMKHKIDTRSTKGRKLRYTVHTKLINFMAPNDQSPWSDEAKQDLYNSLFGKKIMQNE